MKYNDFLNNITFYIDGDLSHSEKIEFEKAISSNKEWNDLYQEIKRNNNLLKNLPEITTKSNFIVNLNNKIDEYEYKKNSSIYSYVKDFIFNIRPIPALSIFSIIFLLSFSMIKINNFSFISDSSEQELINQDNYIAVNESDSLKTNKDSLNYPILLIGNGR